MVPGVGPVPSTIAFVGEAPGYHELQSGIPFTGKTGREFNRYLRIPRLKRKEVYITNLFKEEIPEHPTASDVAFWGEILDDELEGVSPELVVTLGRYSTRWFLGDVNIMDVHGLAVDRDLESDPIVFPIIHPAAGLHSPDQQSAIMADFQNLKRLLSGDDGVYRVRDEYPDPVYVELPRPAMLDADVPVAIDTEGSIENPWGLSLAWKPGHGDVSRFETAAHWVGDPLVILHGALHDYNMLKALNVSLEGRTIVCTQIALFLLGTEPIGLKPAAFRLCGMDMRSYNEVIYEASQQIAREFLEVVNGIQWSPPEPELHFDRAGTPKVKQSRSINWLLTRDFKGLAEGKDIDLRKRWNDWSDGVKAEVIDLYGDMPEATLDDVDPDEAIQYSARDADATMRLFEPVMERIRDTRQSKVLGLDMKIIPMLSRMMEVGMGVDVDQFRALGEELQEDLYGLTETISEMAGRPINPSSDDQVADYLFNELDLRASRITKKKKRGSVDKASLEAIRDAHPVIALLLEYSEKDTLNATFAVSLPRFAKAGRIHPTIRLTRVKSGRLETSKPNLLNIPTRTKLGRRIRAGFIAGDGKELASWDLDQIEMRVIADLSGDPEMIKVLCDPDRHLHKETCSKLYGIPVKDVVKDSTEYLMSKNVSFGIPYGISAPGLVRQATERGVDWDETDCQKFIDEWFAIYKGVYSMIKGLEAQARREGLVRSKLGRIRYLPGVHSDIAWVKAEALRHAVNHPIQTTAQEVIKKAMVTLWDFRTEIQKEGYWEPLLQIHDEVMYEQAEGMFQFVDPIVRACMEGAMDLKVPIRCGGVCASNWAELK